MYVIIVTGLYAIAGSTSPDGYSAYPTVLVGSYSSISECTNALIEYSLKYKELGELKISNTIRGVTARSFIYENGIIHSYFIECKKIHTEGGNMPYWRK